MKPGPPRSFGAQLKALREAAGYTQEELATIAGLSVHGVSALERGERRRPHVETVRALCAALDLSGPTRDALLASTRAPAHTTAVDALSHVSLPLPLTALLGRDTDVKALRDLLADRSTSHNAHRAGRRWEDPFGVGGRTRDRGRERMPCAVRRVGRSSELCVRRACDCRGSRSVGRHRARLAEARADRVRGSAYVAGARQLRARAGHGAAGRGSPDIGRHAPRASDQPRAAPRARRAGVRGGATRIGC